MRFRKVIMWLSVVSIIIYVLSLEYKKSGTAVLSLSYFLEEYINNPQKILLNGSIYGMPVIYLHLITFLEPQMFIRLSGRLEQYIAERNIIQSVVIGSFVLVAHVAVGIIEDYVMDLSTLDFLKVLIKLSSFYICCEFITYDFYIVFKKKAVAVILTTGINLIIMIILFGFIFNSSKAYEESLNLVFYIVVTVYALIAVTAFLVEMIKLPSLTLINIDKGANNEI